MATRLTARKVETAKPTEKEYLLGDGEGMHLRIRPNGAKDWMFMYTFAGKRRKMSLGAFPAIGLADARDNASEQRKLLAQGFDPQLQKQQRIVEQQKERERIAAEQRQITARDLFERWAETDLRRRADGGAEVRRMFEKDVLPLIGNIPAKEVGKAHITGVTDKLLARGVNRMAKLIFSLMRQMLRFGVDRGVIDFDPTATIRKAAIGGKDTERDRVLSEDEIRELLGKLPAAKLIKPTEAAIWIALSTGCRIGELLRASWSDVDLGAGVWVIPPENSKNGEGHRVFLSQFAKAQFELLHEISGAKQWVYPARQGGGFVCVKTVTKQLGDRQQSGEPMSGRAGSRKGRKKSVSETAPTTPTSLVLSGGRWTPHDLRRTAATMMVSLGVLPEVVERCLNHTEENKVKRTYQRHSYEREQTEAWRLLGERLELLVGNTENVLIFRRA